MFSFYEFYPTHDENRMKNEGEVELARKNFLAMFAEQTKSPNHVLYQLLKQRFSWMNDYIRPEDKNIIEIGCGAGLSKFFIKSDKLKLTDVLPSPWVDRHEDALNLSVEDGTLDIVIASHMLHHLASPADFLNKLAQKLRGGGRLIVQDINTGLLMKLALYIMRHEGYSDKVNVFDKNAVCNQASDPWSANCSIPKLLFSDTAEFERKFPMYRVIKNDVNECFMFLFSGGVIAKGPRVPLSKGLTKLLYKFDKGIVSLAPSIFACGRSVVLEKR